MIFVIYVVTWSTLVIIATWFTLITGFVAIIFYSKNILVFISNLITSAKKKNSVRITIDLRKKNKSFSTLNFSVENLTAVRKSFKTRITICPHERLMNTTDSGSRALIKNEIIEIEPNAHITIPCGTFLRTFQTSKPVEAKIELLTKRDKIFLTKSFKGEL